jgi:uncharacterized protein YkwD
VKYSPPPAVLIGALVLLCAIANAQVSPSVIARQLFQQVNSAREAEGLPLLTWDDALARAALWHAQVMAARGFISHQFPGEKNLSGRARRAGIHYNWLAENVAQGRDASRIHQALMDSPPHRANLLDVKLISIGICVMERFGELFVVEDLSQPQGWSGSSNQARAALVKRE